MEAADQLRLMLAEVIQEGETDEDTLFTDVQIDIFLSDAGGSLERAAYEGWRIKAAHYAGLVDVSEGNASRAMSDLHEHALKMVRLYERSTAGPTEGRARVGSIRRRT
jgi:hypothetical protein